MAARPPTDPSAPAKGRPVAGTGAGVQQGMFGELDTPEVRAAIRKTIDKVAKKEAERDKLNAEIKAEREGLVNRGLDRQAVQDAVRKSKMNAAKRRAYDTTYLLTRDVMEAPVIFGAEETEEDPGDDDAPAQTH